MVTWKIAEGYKWTTGHLENGGELQVNYGPLKNGGGLEVNNRPIWKWRRAASDRRATWKMAESYKWPEGHLENGGELKVTYGPHDAQLCYVS